MLEQNHDFEELKQWCEISDMEIANFYLHGEKINIDRNIHKIRKRYFEKTKLEIREHYLLTQNYAATAKEFGVNELTVRTIVKTPTRNGKLNDQENHSGAGRPLTYPLEVEKDILSWLLELKDLHVPVSILTLKKKQSVQYALTTLHSTQVLARLKSISRGIDYHYSAKFH